MVVAEKRRAFKEWLQNIDRASYDKFCAHAESCAEASS